MVGLWWSKDCNYDFSGNGVVGGTQDRAFCVFRAMRSYERYIPNDCVFPHDPLDGDPPGCWTVRDIFFEATDNREWDDLNRAIAKSIDRSWNYGEPTCLAVDIGSHVDAITKRPPHGGPTGRYDYYYNWTTRRAEPGVCAQ
jgi:hypothetical protein